MDQSQHKSALFSLSLTLNRLTVCSVFLAALFTSAVSAATTTLVEVTGTVDSGQTIDIGEAGVVSFTLTQAYSNVSISADILCVGCVGTVYLTDAIGTGTTVSNLITAANFTISDPLALTGLDLAAGIYYVVLDIDDGFAFWSGSLVPTVTEHSDADHSLDFRSDAADASFPPESDFDVIFSEGAMHYQVTSISDDDTDGDGILNANDNCPDVPNAGQENNDGDAEGDVCDTDDDNDGVVDTSDNCPITSNADQADNDGDLDGDVCDSDDDNDTVLDDTDNCPFTANGSQTDSDGDGAGDACDDDTDGDTVPNANDNCPDVPNALQEDNDGDGTGDACDTDDDNDTVPDVDDNCPMTANSGQEDQDMDNIGDVCDSDVDGDGIDNPADNCPIDANPGQDDADLDGVGDACDADDDMDNVLDEVDNCPLIFNPDQADSDGDGDGDVCDGDLDGDGFPNDSDNCEDVANSSQNDLDGDGLGDVCDPDTDGDRVDNENDVCSGTPLTAIVTPDNGCSIAQLCPCEGPRGTMQPWRNHGRYVFCVVKSAKSFLKQDLITRRMAKRVIKKAARSDCGRRHVRKIHIHHRSYGDFGSGIFNPEIGKGYPQ